MFTGIVEGTVKVTSVSRTDQGLRVRLDLGEYTADTKLGDSIAIDGVCLTVAAIKHSILSFDIMPETLTKTTLGQLSVGQVVNIERSLLATARIAGHFVQGHVDGTGVVTDLENQAGNYTLTIEPVATLLPYFIPQGSVAISGVSLTVADLNQSSFQIALIPMTLKLTNLGQLQVGDQVNIETDMLTKHIVHYLKLVSVSKPIK